MARAIMTSPEDQSAAKLRAQAARGCRLAEAFQYDEAAPRLRALADKWAEQSGASDAEVKSDQ
jgi:hypothetical protein